MVKYKEAYDGRLAKVVEFLSELNIHEICTRNHRGKQVCQAVLVEVVKLHPGSGNDSMKHLPMKEIWIQQQIKL